VPNDVSRRQADPTNWLPPVPLPQSVRPLQRFVGALDRKAVEPRRRWAGPALPRVHGRGSDRHRCLYRGEQACRLTAAAAYA